MEKRRRKYSDSSIEDMKQHEKYRSSRKSEIQNLEEVDVKKSKKKMLTTETLSSPRDKSSSPDGRKGTASRDDRERGKDSRRRDREVQKESHNERDRNKRSPSDAREVRGRDSDQITTPSPPQVKHNSPDRHKRSRSISQDRPCHGRDRKRRYRSPLQREKEHPRYWDSSKKYEANSVSKQRQWEDNNSYELGERYYGSTKNEKSSERKGNLNVKKDIVPRKPKVTDMLNTRTGGAYIPPAKLKMMQAEITDKTSAAYQRIAWEALKKSIHGHINKINIGNIGIIIKELLRENIIRGRGLLCRSIIQAQAASPTFTHVYAALVSAINSRFPNIGELLLKRLVIQFKRGFKRNDKAICISAATFVAHLVNQKVTHEILALELLTLLVESPTDDSVEVAIAFLKECGQKLTEVSSKGINAIFEMLRNILHEGHLDKRVQYMIEVMFQIRKDGFKDHVAVIEELELVQEEDQFTHLMMLDEATDPQDILNVFKLDDKYEENEQKYKTLSSEILGSDAESGSDDGSGESGSDEESEVEPEAAAGAGTIIDNTETNLIALRRTIYLTINSSLDFEECAHKLMKMQLKPGQEMELCHMFLDCCAEQRTYEKFYGLLAQRFCQINKIYIGPFEEIFNDSYSTAHRLDTNRLRNVSKFFAHLFFTDSIGWEALECVKLNEEDTTSSSRIYIKIMFQELAEYMGLKKLNDRLKDLTLQGSFAGIFPRDNPKNTRFAINFFTSIGLGGLTDELREHLKQIPKVAPAEQLLVAAPDSSSSSSEDSSSSSSSDSSSSSSSSEDSSSSDEDDRRPSKKKSSTQKKKEKSKRPGSEKENGQKHKRGERDIRQDQEVRNKPDVRPNRHDRENSDRDVQDKVDRQDERLDRHGRNKIDRHDRNKVDRLDKEKVERHGRDEVDRYDREKVDIHDQETVHRHKADKQDRKKDDRQGRNKVDRHDRDKVDRYGRDKAGRHGGDKVDRHGQDKVGRHDGDEFERHGRDKGSRHEPDKVDRHDRDKKDRRNLDKKKR